MGAKAHSLVAPCGHMHESRAGKMLEFADALHDMDQNKQEHEAEYPLSSEMKLLMWDPE